MHPAPTGYVDREMAHPEDGAGGLVGAPDIAPDRRVKAVSALTVAKRIALTVPESKGSGRFTNVGIFVLEVETARGGIDAGIEMPVQLYGLCSTAVAEQALDENSVGLGGNHYETNPMPRLGCSVSA